MIGETITNEGEIILDNKVIDLGKPDSVTPRGSKQLERRVEEIRYYFLTRSSDKEPK